MTETIFIRNEQENDKDEIDKLYGSSFGPGRYAKSTFRYREKYDHLIDISKVIIYQNRLIGSVRFWNILVNGENSLLLGPIAMHWDFRGRGFGMELLKTSIMNCKNLGHNLIILVGIDSSPLVAGLGNARSHEVWAARPRTRASLGLCASCSFYSCY